MPMGTRTSGPLHLFARFRSVLSPQQGSAGSGSGVYYLGTCVASPEPEHTKYELPVMNDITGRSVPLQLVEDGEDAKVLAVMNRFDYLLLQSIRALNSASAVNANPGAGNVGAGQQLASVRGTFIIGRLDFQLIVWSEYAGQIGVSGTANDESPIRQYNSVTMPGYKESRVGTRVLEVACGFKCNNVYNYQFINFAGGTGNTAGGVYTENPGALGSVTPASLAAIVIAVSNAGGG